MKPRCPHCQSTEFRIRMELGREFGRCPETGYVDTEDIEYGECKRCGQAFSLDESEDETEARRAA